MSNHLLTVKMAGAVAPPSPASPDTSLLYRALAMESKAQWPEAEVTPYLFQAGTDAAAWNTGTIYELVKKSDTTIWVRQGKRVRHCTTPDKRFKFFARPKLDEEGLRRLYLRED